MTRLAPRPITLAVAIAVTLAFVGGCGSDSDSDGSAAADRPAGAGELVASRRFAGGFVPVGADLASLPDVVVYGDGLALAPTQDGRVLEIRLSAGELDDLVERLADTGLADYPERVEPDGPMVVMDASDTVLGVATSDGFHEVAANALDMAELGYPDDLRAASAILQALGDRVRAEGDEWTSDRVRLVVQGAAGDGVRTTWPADVAVPAELGQFDENSVEPIVVAFAGTDADGLAATFGLLVPAAIQLPDGTGVSATLRPLLPHE